MRRIRKWAGAHTVEICWALAAALAVAASLVPR